MNTRKQNEGSEDGKRKVLAIDLSMKGTVHGAVLADLLGCTAKQAMVFWRSGKEESDNKPTYTGMVIESSFEGTGHTVKLARYKYENCTVTKFKAKPIDGLMVELTFQIRLSNPADKDVENIAGIFKADVVACNIEGPPDLFKD